MTKEEVLAAVGQPVERFTLTKTERTEHGRGPLPRGWRTCEYGQSFEGWRFSESSGYTLVYFLAASNRVENVLFVQEGTLF